jgi:HK97 family phage major capsid protein
VDAAGRGEARRRGTPRGIRRRSSASGRRALQLAHGLRQHDRAAHAPAEQEAHIAAGRLREAEGILTNADIAFTVSGSAATIADAEGQGNGPITPFHALKTAYARNAVWTLNRVTLGSVRKLKDADKNYVWMPGLPPRPRRP